MTDEEHIIEGENQQQLSEEAPQQPNSSQKKSCKLFCIILLAIIVLCMAGLVIATFNLVRNNSALHSSITQLTTDSQTQSQTITSLQSTVQQMNQSSQQIQQTVQQQQQVLTNLQQGQLGNVNKWRILEAQYMVRLANTQLKFANNSALALVLLQQADSLLKDMADAEPIRQAIANQIVQLQSVSTMDTNTLYMRLNALDNEVDHLPLQSLPLKENSQPSAETNAPPISWWRAGLNHALQTLSSLIVIRDTTKTPLPLLMPEEKMFLYQNLHAQFANAIWGVLNQKPIVFETSLTRIGEWITTYFNAEDPATKTLLQTLAELKKINIASSATIDFSTLNASFDTYLQQTNATTNNSNSGSGNAAISPSP